MNCKKNKVSFYLLCFLLLLISSNVQKLFAEPSELQLIQAHYQMSIDVNESDLALDSDVRVVLQLQAEHMPEEVCVYVPALDPQLERLQHRLMMRGAVPQDKLQRKGLQFQWARPDQWQDQGSGVFRLQAGERKEQLMLAFTAALLGWRDRPSGLRIFSEFYPRLLSRCPQAEEDASQAARLESKFSIRVNSPENWSLLGPGHRGQKEFSWRGPAWSLLFYQEGKLASFELGGLRLHVLSEPERIEQLAPPALAAIAFYQRLLGPPAVQELFLIETEDHEPLQAPGLILLNRPQQPFLRRLQEDWLRWNLWQMSQTLAAQWFGQTVRTKRAEQQWLTHGLAHVLAGQFLDSYPPYNQLFLEQAEGESLLQLDYQEAQDLTAALGRVYFPQKPLWPNAQPNDLNHVTPLLHMKQALAMRYLAWLMGEQSYARWLTELSLSYRDRTLSPDDLLASLPGDAAEDLRRYWQTLSWPDFGIEELRAEGEQTRLLWQQNPELPLAFDVVVKLRSGKQWQELVAQRAATGELLLPFPQEAISSVRLNPSREIFDADRFNNRSDWASPQFFPGNARNLADDAYTFLWFPGFSKLPGEGFSMQLYWQAFRYVGSELSGRIVFHPSDARRGYRILYNHRLPDQALSLSFALYQGDGLAIEGERLGDLSLAKREIFGTSMTSELGFRLRQKLGDPDATHTTHRLRLWSKIPLGTSCDLQLEGQIEQSGLVPSGKFAYLRKYGSSEASCASPRFKGNMRGFFGQLKAQGEPPQGAYFAPQLIEEARVRLDRPTLASRKSLASLGLDLAMSMPLPLPNSLFTLPRRSMVKSYGDLAWDPDTQQLAQVGGLGLEVPFGGDVTGRESITAVKLNLYGVFYRKIGGQLDRRPGLLLDFSGKL